MIIVNLSFNLVVLTGGQVIPTVDENRAALMEYDISHSEMLGFTDHDNRYRKRDHRSEEVALINRYLADARDVSLKADYEEPVTADTAEIGMDGDAEDRIKAMLRKHESLWSDKLSKTTATKHHICLLQGSRPFNSAPYRVGLKT